MILWGRFTWKMGEQPTFYDHLRGQTVLRRLSPIRFAGKEDDVEYNHADHVQSQDLPKKDQGEEPVGINLVTKGEEAHLS